MQTVPQLFLAQVADRPHETAIFIKQYGRYRSLTWHEVGLDVRRYVANFLRLGVQAGDRVVQFSENRYEWILADLAMHILGAVHVPVHATLSGAQVAQQATDCGAELLLVSTSDLLNKLAAASLPLPRAMVVCSYEQINDEFRGRPVELFDGQADEQPAREAERTVAARIQPESLATILYTSGTTGEPKGVMLDQRNLATNAVGTTSRMMQRKSDLRLNFLPLSHIFARTCDLYTWVVGGSQLALAESRETVVQDCHSVHPTVMNAVPYFYARLQKHLANQGREHETDAVKHLLGGRVRLCCSGGAPLPLPLYDYFQSQGLPILQGYGLTESSPVITASSLSLNRRGAVGNPIDDVAVKIATDGEVLTQGPQVMTGYWQNRLATDEVIRDGWLHTGDLGRIDEEGFLYITGRKKETIVTATGKNIAPAYLEALLAADALIAQALIVGDNCKFLAALIVPDLVALKKAMAVEQLPDLNGSAVQSLLAERIAVRLRDVGKHEQIGRFTVLARPFSPEDGEVTAKLSLRRKVIEEHFAAEIEAIYAE